MGAGITVYISSPAAPLCARVCDFLTERGYDYTIVDVEGDAARDEMKRLTGYSSCPLVVAGGEAIGKLEDTIEAERSGRLRGLSTRE